MSIGVSCFLGEQMEVCALDMRSLNAELGGGRCQV